MGGPSASSKGEGHTPTDPTNLDSLAALGNRTPNLSPRQVMQPQSHQQATAHNAACQRAPALAPRYGLPAQAPIASKAPKLSRHPQHPYTLHGPPAHQRRHGQAELLGARQRGLDAVPLFLLAPLLLTLGPDCKLKRQGGDSGTGWYGRPVLRRTDKAACLPGLPRRLEETAGLASA